MRMLIWDLIRGECVIHVTNLPDQKVVQYINWNKSIPTIDSNGLLLTFSYGDKFSIAGDNRHITTQQIFLILANSVDTDEMPQYVFTTCQSNHLRVTHTKRVNVFCNVRIKLILSM